MIRYCIGASETAVPWRNFLTFCHSVIVFCKENDQSSMIWKISPIFSFVIGRILTVPKGFQVVLLRNIWIDFLVSGA